MPVVSTPPTPTQQALLGRYRQAGVVLEVAFFTYPSGAGAPGELARAAVEQAVPTGRKTGTPVGAPLAVLDWLTTRYDVVAGTLHLFSYGKDFRSRSTTTYKGLPRALFDPPYAVRFPELKSGWPRTPDELAANEAVLGELLREFLSVIVGIDDPDDVDGLALTAWTTDWHSYFDAGREWWGSFCWTAHWPDRRSIVVLTASSTD
jgi:hypothetical protein